MDLGQVFALFYSTYKASNLARSFKIRRDRKIGIAGARKHAAFFWYMPGSQDLNDIQASRMTEIYLSSRLKSNYDDYYEEGASEWRRLGALGKADNIVSICGNLPRESVIEIGAGEGSVIERLSELGFGKQLYAVEISQSGLDVIAKKKISRLAECKAFDGYDIPYENDRFDIAILSHVVEHVEHPRQLIYDASRVARYVFVEVPLEDTVRLPNDFVFDKVGHINYYSPKTIRRLVQSCDLRVIRQITTNPTKAAFTYMKGYKGLINYYIKQFLLRAAPRAATAIFTYHAALVCERDPSVASRNDTERAGNRFNSNV